MGSLKSDKTFDEASATAQRFMRLLPVESIVAGSLRRKAEVVGDVDIVSIGCFPMRVEGATFISGRNILRTYMFEDTQINVMIAAPDYLGATLLYATGSGKWGFLLRLKAKRKGFKLNRYGLFKRDTDQLIASTTEQDIFDALEKRFVPPENRVR